MNLSEPRVNSASRQGCDIHSHPEMRPTGLLITTYTPDRDFPTGRTSNIMIVAVVAAMRRGQSAWSYKRGRSNKGVSDLLTHVSQCFELFCTNRYVFLEGTVNFSFLTI